MTEVRTREEAINLLAQALTTWSTTMSGVLLTAESVGRAASERCQRAVRDRRNVVAVLRQRLDAAADSDKGRLQAELRRAEDALGLAERAAAQTQTLLQRLAQLARSHATGASGQVGDARGELRRMTHALQGYRSGGPSSGTGGSGGSGLSGATADSVSGLSKLGMTELDVSAADLASNPILDGDPGAATFGKGGLTRADFRWAVQTWSDTVGPGVARGQTRDDFAARDAASSAPPLRRTADVYDLFLGSDRIRVNRRPDGSLDITGGRHRLLIARELGIKTLPGEVY